jgi:hypothetical protein
MSEIRSMKWSHEELDLPISAKLMRQSALAALGWLVASAGVISMRAFAGALERPLPSSGLLATGLLVVFLTAMVRMIWMLPMVKSPFGRLDLAAMAIATFSAAALCGTLCLPRETSSADVILICALFVAEEGWAWLWIFRKWKRNAPPRAEISTDAPIHGKRTISWDGRPTATPTSHETTSIEKNNSDPLMTQDPPAAEVLQQMTRTKAADGAEELAGWLRMPFAPGQRTGSVHVAFCPPLPALPELSVEQIDGPEARVKTAQLLPYGVRLDLKLIAAAEETTSVLLQFSARTAAR